jgi:hypothetical protein
MARFAGSPLNRARYDFSPSIQYQQVPGTSAASQSAGSVVPGMYNQLAQTGWQPGDTLANSIANRANEKTSAINADALVRRYQIQGDATKEAAKIQSEAAKDAYAKQAQGSMMGSAFGAIGSIAVGLMGSDRTIKNTIETIDNALGTLRDLRPVTFYYNEEYSSSPERLHHGFIAQEYAKVLPDATYFDESTEKLCIDTGELIALLVRSVQQLETRISHMEAVQALVGVK